MRTGRTLHPLYKIKEKRENIFGFSNFKSKEKQTNSQRKSFWIFNLARKEQNEETEKEKKERKTVGLCWETPRGRYDVAQKKFSLD